MLNASTGNACNAASPLIGTKLRAWAVSKGLTTEDEYAYRSCHDVTIGNENLTRKQVDTLYKFAVLIERYLMNRGGILKDEARSGALYHAAFSCADWAARLSARIIFAVGRSYFQRSDTIPPPQSQGVAP